MHNGLCLCQVDMLPNCRHNIEIEPSLHRQEGMWVTSSGVLCARRGTVKRQCSNSLWYSQNHLDFDCDHFRMFALFGCFIHINASICQTLIQFINTIQSYSNCFHHTSILLLNSKDKRNRLVDLFMYREWYTACVFRVFACTKEETASEVLQGKRNKKL